MLSNNISEEGFNVDISIVFLEYFSDTRIARGLNMLVEEHNSVHLWVSISVDIVGVIEDLDLVVSILHASERVILG